MGLELTPDRHPPITSQTHYSLRHTALLEVTIGLPPKYHFSTYKK